MYKITDELDINGFSINPLHLLIQRNQGNRTFGTRDYFCIYIAMENIEITVADKKYKLPAGSLAFVSPEKNIVFGTDCEKQNSIYVLAFSESFYEKSARDSLLLNSELFFNAEGVFIAPVIGSIDNLEQLIINRLNLYKEKGNVGLYVAVAHNCVEILIMDGLLTIDKQLKEQKTKSQKLVFLDIANRFRILLQKHYRNSRSVGFYSELLHITPRELSIVSETVLNKTAKQVILEEVTIEAVRMLKHSHLSIKEIAAEFGFSDIANFSTFIKTHANKNPRDFREGF